MSSEVVIKLRGVSKTYRIYSKPGDRMKQALWGKRKIFYRKINALKNIDLDIFKGETIGIVGSKGSGKSTLLQVICGTLGSDSGELEVHGRIAALLELGTSFNPEFTGRENVAINGLIMGLSKAELAEKYDDIIEFADIGQFINQPVKTYSSGMFARLAFAVAIHVDPQVLVIDEALAVGDEAFQRKCFARLEKIKANGTTILFVSHSASAVLELCDRAVMMYKGERVLTGEPRDVIKHYQKLIYSSASNHPKILQVIRQVDAGEMETNITSKAELKQQVKSGAAQMEDYLDHKLIAHSTEHYPLRGCEITDVQILDDKDNHVNVLTSNGSYIYQYRVCFLADASNVRFAMLIKTTTGVELGAQWTKPRDDGIPHVKVGSVLTVRLPFNLPLNEGTYFGNAGVHGIVNGELVVMHRIIDAVMFRVRPTGRRLTDRYVNIIADKAQIKSEPGQTPLA